MLLIPFVVLVQLLLFSALLIDSASVPNTPRFIIACSPSRNVGSTSTNNDRHRLLVRRFRFPWFSKPQIKSLPSIENDIITETETEESSDSADTIQELDVEGSEKRLSDSDDVEEPETPELAEREEFDHENYILLESDSDEIDTECEDWEQGRTVNDRYRLLDLIGHGSYGAVVRAVDMQTDNEVAVKIMFHIPENEESRIITVDGKEWEIFDSSEQAENELEAFRYLNNQCDYCIEMLDNFTDDEATYIVMPLMATSLFDALNSQRLSPSSSFSSDKKALTSIASYFSDIKINLNKMRRVARQLFEGLECMHHVGVAHNDVKPENILIDAETKQLKLIDYSFSCPVNHMDKWPGGTAWFEDPIITMYDEGSEKSDIWSAGLVLAEVLYGHAILPFEENMHRLYAIQLLLGLEELPDSRLDLNHVFGKSRWKFIATEEMTRLMRYHGGQHLFTKENFMSEYQWSEDARQLSDLIKQCLRLYPEDRPSASDVLRHPFFRKRS